MVGTIFTVSIKDGRTRAGGHTDSFGQTRASGRHEYQLKVVVMSLLPIALNSHVSAIGEGINQL